MNLFEKLNKVSCDNLYVGTIYDPQAYFLDDNGKPNGLTKAIPTGQVVIAERLENGDYRSIVDGTVYSEGSVEKIVKEETEGFNFFYNVIPFAKVAFPLGQEKGSVRRGSVAKLETGLNACAKEDLMTCTRTYEDGYENETVCIGVKFGSKKVYFRVEYRGIDLSSPMFVLDSNGELDLTYTKLDKNGNILVRGKEEFTIDPKTIEALTKAFPELAAKFGDRVTTLEMDQMRSEIYENSQNIQEDSII